MGLDIAIASAVVEIITLIFFFVLCRNVSKIKKEIVSNDNLPGMFAMYISLGETDKAKKYCIRRLVKNRNLSQHSATMAIIQHSNLH